MLWEVYRYINHRWIESYFIATKCNFTYEFFDWVKPWPGEGMYFHFYLLGILSVLIALGLFYRVATVLFFLAFTYVFLLEQARYLNHFYLVVLVSFLMIFIPAHRNYSIDAWRRKHLKTSTIPFWTLFLIQFQIVVVYFFGFVAKMNSDWIGGEPMRHWLARRTVSPLIGQFFDQEWLVYSMSHGGLLLDLLAPLLLVWRRTRPFMMLAVLIFHFMNDRLFSIGIFPWFMILASMMLFPSDWPRQFVRAVQENRNGSRAYILAGGGRLFCLRSGSRRWVRRGPIPDITLGRRCSGVDLPDGSCSGTASPHRIRDRRKARGSPGSRKGEDGHDHEFCIHLGLDPGTGPTATLPHSGKRQLDRGGSQNSPGA